MPSGSDREGEGAEPTSSTPSKKKKKKKKSGLPQDPQPAKEKKAHQPITVDIAAMLESLTVQSKKKQHDNNEGEEPGSEMIGSSSKKVQSARRATDVR